MDRNAQTPDQTLSQSTEISLLDVKELYDMAYSHELTDQSKFKALLGEAVKMDLAYRRQLVLTARYKDRTKEKVFNAAGDVANARAVQ